MQLAAIETTNPTKPNKEASKHCDFGTCGSSLCVGGCLGLSGCCFGLFPLYDGSWPIISIELSNNDYFSTAWQAWSIAQNQLWQLRQPAPPLEFPGEQGMFH